MNRLFRRPAGALAALWLCVLLTAVATVGGLGLLVPLSADAALIPVGYKHESESDLDKQAAAKQIRTATINRFLHAALLTLRDGEHLFVKYKKHQEPAIAARLKASGATVTVLSKAEGEKAPHAKKTHHKTRYIIGGAVIVVLLIVGAVLLLLYRRRRRRD